MLCSCDACYSVHDMLIRPATTHDARAIARIQVRGWQIGYRGIVPDDYLARFTEESLTIRWLANLAELKRMDTLIAEDEEERIAGWARFGANESDLAPDVGEIGGLYVEPDSWKRGIGSTLLEHAEGALLAQGYVEAILWTLAENDRTRRFYENRGWVADGATESHASGAAVVRYVKSFAGFVDRRAASE